MSMNRMIDLDKACGRKLSEAETVRLREIGERLDLREDDALWPLLAAMEYQRVYYEALPEKIAAASRTIMDGMAAAAEKETAAAQARLTDSVVKEARNLASTIQYDRLVPMGVLALICLLAYGSLMLWAGFRIGSGRDMPLAVLLHMPSGWLISGLCLAAGVFCWVVAAVVLSRRKAEEVAAKLRDLRLDRAARVIAEGCDETLTYYDFPSAHWRNLRTNNPQERPDREIRR